MPPQPSWREKARATIDRVLSENPEAQGEELRKLLSKAYPLIGRRNFPYRVYMEEIRKTMQDREKAPDLKNFWIGGKQ